jgi:hypothetical protein
LKVSSAAVVELLSIVLPVTVFPPAEMEAICGAATAVVCEPTKIGT